MYSYADRHTHDFFFGRDYPPVGLLDRIFAVIGDESQSKETVRRKAKMEEDIFEKALEKLWIHKGAVVDFAENVSRGIENWRTSYSLQAEQKKDQLEEMIRFAETHHCRMTSLVQALWGYVRQGERAADCATFVLLPTVLRRSFADRCMRSERPAIAFSKS